jgi:hypothetical protein
MHTPLPRWVMNRLPGSRPGAEAMPPKAAATPAVVASEMGQQATSEREVGTQTPVGVGV